MKGVSPETFFSLSPGADAGSQVGVSRVELDTDPGRRGRARWEQEAGPEERARELTRQAGLRHEEARRSPHSPTRT